MRKDSLQRKSIQILTVYEKFCYKYAYILGVSAKLVTSLASSRVLLSMAEPIEPYVFEPLMTAEELDSLRQRMEDDEGHNSEENGEQREERIGHNRWCLRGRCPAMATAKEAVCCREICKATDKMGSNACITAHPSFERVCLDMKVLRTALVAMSDARFDRYLELI